VPVRFPETRRKMMGASSVTAGSRGCSGTMHCQWRRSACFSRQVRQRNNADINAPEARCAERRGYREYTTLAQTEYRKFPWRSAACHGYNPSHRVRAASRAQPGCFALRRSRRQL
jgi:hypothetical protein